jgi:hypothetical protein
MRSLTIIFLLCVVGLAQAQQSEPEERWWWAYRESTGEVLAYNADGDSKVVLDGVQRYQENNDTAVFRTAIRVTPDTMVAVAKVNGEYGLYKFVRDSVQLMESLPNLNEDVKNARYAYQFIVADAPYVVMTGFPAGAYLLDVYNIENNRKVLFEIDADFYCPDHIFIETIKNCFGISGEENVIRYAAGSLDEEDATWTITEQNLVTGETKPIYTYIRNPEEEFSDWCQPDKVGLRWICVNQEGDLTDWYAYYIIQADGSILNITKKTPGLAGFYVGADVSEENDILFTDVRDAPIYKIKIYPPNQNEPEVITAYSTYPIHSMFFRKIRRFPNHLLIQEDIGRYFLIKNSGEVTYIGASLCCHIIEPVSSDYRWLITDFPSGDDWGLWLWDTQQGQQLFEINDMDEVYGGTNFTDFGLIIGKEWVYRYTDAAPLSLPAELDGEYHDVLPDGTLLYYQPQATELRGAGIYRYNPDTSEISLLVADAAPIFILKE